MKKILVALFLTVSLGAFAAYTGGWNYYYNPSKDACFSTAKSGITIGFLLNRGCTIDNFQRKRTVAVLDCNDDPDIQGYVWFGRTLTACQWIKNNID